MSAHAPSNTSVPWWKEPTRDQWNAYIAAWLGWTGLIIGAVNALGVKGGPSPYVLTIPSALQHPFSREKGQTCDQRWAKNPEAGPLKKRVRSPLGGSTLTTSAPRSARIRPQVGPMTI